MKGGVSSLSTWGLRLLGPRFLYLHLGAAAIALGVGSAMMKPDLTRERAQWVAEAKAWTIAGPPCPTRPAAAADPWPYGRQPDFGYAGANFRYAYGHVACLEIHDDGGRSATQGHAVCQFTSPAMVAVTVGKTLTVFEPGLGRRATVTVEKGAPRCVVAGDFRGQLNF